MRGPLDLGFALSRLSPRPDRREQRAVVIGDGDFLSNRFLGNGGNRELGQRVFNWLLAATTFTARADTLKSEAEVRQLADKVMACRRQGWSWKSPNPPSLQTRAAQGRSDRRIRSHLHPEGT